MRVQNILTRVRDTLSDPTGERWSDDTLVRLLNEGQVSICRTTKILKKQAALAVMNGEPRVILPEDLIMIDKLVYNNSDLPLITMRDLDELGQWFINRGEPTKFVYDKRNRKEGRLYPIPEVPEENLAKLDNFGVITSLNDINIVPDLGVFTGYPLGSTDLFGVTVSVPQNLFFLNLMYSALPIELVDINSELEIDSIYDVALKYYVSGMALRDDMDTQNRQFGAEELQLYAAELNKLIDDYSKSYTSEPRQLEVQYTGAF